MTLATRPQASAQYDNVLSMAGWKAGRGHDLAVVSGEVIARRLAMGVSAMLDPPNADHGELARLVPEKSDAISASGMALFQRSAQVVEEIARFANDEALLASRACVTLASCRTPAAFVAAQQGFTFAWLARVMSRAGAMSALAMRSHDDALTPSHSAATAHAARLTGN